MAIVPQARGDRACRSTRHLHPPFRVRWAHSRSWSGSPTRTGRCISRLPPKVADPLDPIEIHANIFGDPGDLDAVITAKELCRDLANSDIFRPFLKREITSGRLNGSALEQIVRNSVSTIWHQSCTAKM
jgi:choline dehydrogenase-like flavoprotein